MTLRCSISNTATASRGSRLGPLLQLPAQSLAEQRSLGESGQRLEIGQESHGVLLVQILEREREIGGHFLEEQQFLGTDDAARSRAAEEGADRSAVHSQRQARHRSNARRQQAISALDHQGGLGDILAKRGLAGADDTSHETGIAAS